MPEKSFYKMLVDRYTSKKATEEELMIFFDLLQQGRLDNYLSEAFLSPVGITHVDVEPEDETNVQGPLKTKTLRMKTWMKVAVAAAILAIISTVILIAVDRQTIPASSVTVNPAPAILNLPPGGNKATLTLADGSSILLENARNGQLAQQGKTKVVKLDAGRLVYRNESGSATGITSFNTITTPRGGEYQVTLPDGSQVWLNAGSSLRYPTAFNNSERVVELEGEGYFEVAHHANAPFRIKMDRGVSIQVLGTDFNVHAYHEEPVQTTLLQGAISIRTEKASATLKPGQSAAVTSSGQLNVVQTADTSQAVAWKNGLFQFNRANLGTIMRQIERWYDVDVIYQGVIPDKEFVGKVSRKSNLSEVLQILELSNIHFKIEGKKIIVMP